MVQRWCALLVILSSLSGCAHSYADRYSAWQPGVNPGLSLLRGDGTGEDASEWARLHRGLLMRVNQEPEPVSLVGANPTDRTVVFLTRSNDLISLPYNRIGELSLLTGATKAKATRRVRPDVMKSSVITGTVIGSIPGGLGVAATTVVAVVDHPCGMRCGVLYALSIVPLVAGALLGAGIGSLVGMSRRVPSEAEPTSEKLYRIGPGDWRIIGGQTDR